MDSLATVCCDSAKGDAVPPAERSVQSGSTSNGDFSKRLQGVEQRTRQPCGDAEGRWAATRA